MRRSRRGWAPTRPSTGSTSERAGVPCGRVLGLGEVFSDPQALDQEMVLSQEHPGHGIVKMLGFPIKFAEAPCSSASARPEIGADTDAVLGEFGYSAANRRVAHARNRLTRRPPEKKPAPLCGAGLSPKTRTRLQPGAIGLALAADLVGGVGRRIRIEPVPAAALPRRRSGRGY